MSLKSSSWVANILHRCNLTYKLVNGTSDRSLLCWVNFLHNFHHAVHSRLVQRQNLLLLLFFLSLRLFTFLSALLTKWSKAVESYIFSIVRIFIRLMHGRTNSANFTYRLSFDLRALRADARAIEVAIAVIDQREVKESWNKASLQKEDMLDDHIEVFHRYWTVCKSSE